MPAPRDGAPALDELEFELHERLKQWRKERAQALGLDSSLVINRHVLARLAQTKPRRREELERVDGLLAWQLEAFGDSLLEVVRRGLEELSSRPPARGRRRFRSGPAR
jgi:superfamily II DNA helicase RecQ